ncbi:MAG: DUF4292 domain-containing protein [Deltaproteobacteria bacterium]|nr:DUF4292 domain-containing protein [Deltaproteobacteria bacterium]MBN2671020.1 DUF4292 domain-containing protein [Deltaproteobacteria bacterium]
MKRRYSQFVPTVLALVFIAACGPIRPPRNAYQDANTLLSEMEKLRAPIHSFRIAGSIDHVQEQRIRGKAYMFSKLPDNLRIDILSPFGNTLSVLTADKKKFGLSDYKTGRFFSGAPKPCNVARFVGVALPPKDVITIMVGKIPIIKGEQHISWHEDGHYVVTITNATMTQVLHIGADKETLPLLSASLTENGKKTIDISYDMWRFVGDLYVPYEIRIQMPNDNAELFVQYEEDGVELNVELPEDAWDQTIPDGARMEALTCE